MNGYAPAGRLAAADGRDAPKSPSRQPPPVNIEARAVMIAANRIAPLPNRRPIRREVWLAGKLARIACGIHGNMSAAHEPKFN
jgi:hypothetical protein